MQLQIRQPPAKHEGICHRDLKPQVRRPGSHPIATDPSSLSNIPMASLCPIWVKIADFGATKQTKFTALRTSYGTHGYLAPEMIGFIPRSTQRYTYALDMWSLGCLLHKLLTSDTPFLEKVTTPITEDALSGLSQSDFEAQTDMAFLY